MNVSQTMAFVSNTHPQMLNLLSHWLTSLSATIASIAACRAGIMDQFFSPMTRNGCMWMCGTMSVINTHGAVRAWGYVQLFMMEPLCASNSRNHATVCAATNLILTHTWQTYITVKKHLLFWQLYFSMELQLLTRIVPCGNQLWAIQHTLSTGTAEVATRAGRHQISAIHNKLRALFPCKEP